MRRLRDVNARFQPLMNRIDGNLLGIQSELGLPPSTLALPPGNAHLRIPGQGGSESGGDNGGGYLAIEDTITNNAAPGKRSKDANNELESMPTSERVEELPASSSSSSSSRDGNRRVPLSPSQVAFSQEQNNGADASPSHPIPDMELRQKQPANGEVQDQSAANREPQEQQTTNLVVTLGGGTAVGVVCGGVEVAGHLSAAHACYIGISTSVGAKISILGLVTHFGLAFIGCGFVGGATIGFVAYGCHILNVPKRNLNTRI
jgi:hypothetical protein